MSMPLAKLDLLAGYALAFALVAAIQASITASVGFGLLRARHGRLDRARNPLAGGARFLGMCARPLPERLRDDRVRRPCRISLPAIVIPQILDGRPDRAARPDAPRAASALSGLRLPATPHAGTDALAASRDERSPLLGRRRSTERLARSTSCCSVERPAVPRSPLGPSDAASSAPTRDAVAVYCRRFGAEQRPRLVQEVRVDRDAVGGAERERLRAERRLERRRRRASRPDSPSRARRARGRARPSRRGRRA